MDDSCTFMTLDEAIVHAQEVYEKDTTTKCALNHLQLAEWLKHYQSLLKTDTTAMKEILAEDPNTSPALLVELFEYHNYIVKMLVCANINTPVDLLVKAADMIENNRKNHCILTGLSKNPKLPQDKLIQVYMDSYKYGFCNNDAKYIRKNVKQNPSFTKEMNQEITRTRAIEKIHRG